MERVFCVNRTEVNKSYSRSRAWKSPKSRTSERSVPPFARFSRSFARSLSFYTRMYRLARVRIPRIDRKLEIRRLRLFFALSSLLARRYYSAQPVKEKKSEATDQSLSRSIPDTCRSYAASTQTGAIASNGNVIFCRLPEEVRYTPWWRCN